MRAIDADELRKQFDTDDAYLHDYTNIHFLKAIDNAPTVRNEYMRGYEAAEREYKRPQGEWIDGYCNKCGASTPCDGWGRDRESNFCPNCGADMRKGGRNENI